MFVNDTKLEFNELRELKDEEVIILTEIHRFTFKAQNNPTDTAMTQPSNFHERYMTTERVGQEHWSEVFLCVEMSAAKNTYAVEIAAKQSNQLSLRHVAKILMAVKHPNIICVKEFLIPDGDQNEYLVTEHAPEGDLFKHIVRRQKLSEHECRRVFTQLFNAIKYLHDHNIAHLDIKPEGIWVFDPELDLVKLANFDLSTHVRPDYPLTKLCGTPSYVAPEVLAERESREYGKMADIWSLGVVLYICLCGFPPFSDELNTKEFPYTLTQQIKSGRFDYPSPYWDSVGDPARKF
ncbi:CAMK/RAD53 protein kinase [Apiospora kogelbergensis]|uniref:CAMK/RAD53 protein kinase n=1 Tax=Apiospora kogelbergensis TaxID=1337665 RepID=UPI00312D160C